MSTLLALRDMAGAAAEIDLEAEDAATTASEPLQRLVSTAIELMGTLQAADDQDHGTIVIELDVIEPDAWTGMPQSGSTPRVADVSFAGGMELRRVLRELVAAQDADEKLAAAESARRKLRRAIRATLEAARESGLHDVLGGEHQGRHQVADLASALAVRRLYAQFRRTLRRPTDDSADGVLTAIRYAGGALATLVAHPDYADVRASDRAILRRLRERALQWARTDRSVATGLHLLEDVKTCGDLLRGINLRQELQAHDRALVASALSSSHDDALLWFANLDPLVGLDDSLDVVLEEARSSGDPARSIPEAMKCLTRMVR